VSSCVIATIAQVELLTGCGLMFLSFSSFAALIFVVVASITNLAVVSGRPPNILIMVFLFIVYIAVEVSQKQ
jgi:hypothetical protein